MSSETITQLPVGIPQLSDIIYAVQNYVSPSFPGTSVQESLQSVSELLQSAVVLTNEGNPNGVLAGYVYQLCWDSINGILYVCTTTGIATAAVWSKSITLTGGSGVTIVQNGNIIEISSSITEITFNNITATSVNMATNNAYQANNALRVALTLPVVAAFGDELWISGYGAGGWNIVQSIIGGIGQQIIVGNQQTTAGPTGSLASTNARDGIQFYCVVPNLIWKNISAPQGALTYV